MVKEIKLDVQARTEKKGQAKKIRTNGFIPAVLYGPGMVTHNLKVKRHDFEQVFALAGESHLIDLAIDGKETVKVIIKDIHRNPIKDEIIHADFYKVDMKKKIEVEIPLHFIGEAKAVKELGGTLVKNIDSLEVKCLPGDLIDKFDIDLSVLETFDDFIRVRDLNLPSTLEIIYQPESLVAHVVEPRVEEEVVEEEVIEEEEKEAGAEAGEEKAEEKKEEGGGEGDEIKSKEGMEKSKKK